MHPRVATLFYALIWIAAAAPAPGARAAAWSNPAPLQVARQELAVAELDGRLYVVGGIQGVNVLSLVEVYDPVGDAWSFVAPLPTGVHHSAAASVDGKLYVIGGWSDFFATVTANVWEYDPGLDVWTAKAPMPLARAALAAAVVDGKIYTAGGWPAARSTDFSVYDPDSDAWTALPDLPTPRNHLGAAATGGIFYAVGGRSELGAGAGNVGAVEAFDPATGSWIAMAPLPTARSGLGVAAIDSLILALGGEGNDANPDGTFGQNEALDVRAERYFSFEPLPTPVHGIGAAVLDGRVHVPGGGPVEGFSHTQLHQVYDPLLDSAFPRPIPGLGAYWSALLGCALLGALLRTPCRATRRALKGGSEP